MEVTFKCKGCGIDKTVDNKGGFLLKYCSNKCQGETTRKKRIQAWLDGKKSNPSSNSVRWWYEQIGSYHCALCGISEWRDIKLVLEMDHIDGNSTNGIFSNIRLICPNCASQLPTFKSKNKGSGRHYRRQRYAKGDSY